MLGGDLHAANLVAANNADGVASYGAASSFHINLLAGTNSAKNCSGIQGGLVHTTCTQSGDPGSTDYGSNASNARFQPGIDLQDSFTPQWGQSALDTTNRNRSGDGSSENYPLAPGAACPPELHGNVTMDDQQDALYVPGMNALEIVGDLVGNDDGICQLGERCFNRFLINAYEINLDTIGDDDGLCESNEACVYAPNFGWYQGEGDLTKQQTCVFSNGAVENVSLFAFPVNGS